MFSGFKSSEAKYTSLDGSNTNLHYPNQHVYRYFTNTLHFWREAVIVFLSIVCTILALEQTYYRPDQPEARAKVPEYQLTSSDTRWREFQWYSNIYSSPDPNDDQAVNEAWDRIIPAHGFVTVDHEWAAAHHLPDTMSLPSDNSKGVYIIDAYHQIHCLTILRKTLTELAAGQTPSLPMGHSRHCFDSLLQYIMCGTSGDTLLYTWGRNQTGNGQLRRCIDWDSRRDWAKNNSACYVDSDHPIALYDHFGHCESREHDGIRMYNS